MLTRNYLIFSRYVWHQTIELKKNHIQLKVRHLSIVCKPQSKINQRFFSWTSVLYKENKNDPPKNEQNVKKEENVMKVSSQLTNKEATILLDNVKEKSLEEKNENEPGRRTTSDSIKELTKKIIGKVESDQVEVKQVPKERKRLDLTVQSLERNFITPVKAMSDFLLKPSDLESLPKTKRRSPYESEPPITVYWRKDVEAKALEVWKSHENLKNELMKRDIEKKKYQQNIFTMKRRLRDFRREMDKPPELAEEESGLLGRSGRVVMTAVAINGLNFLFKLFAWFHTGSHSMFSECIHSLADTINQLILAYGIHKSVQAYFILGGSLVSEGATWVVAFNSIRKGAKGAKMSVKDYIFRGQDPSVNVVLLEDFAAVVGVVVAGGCMGISSATNSPLADSMGSLIVGCILGSVASFIIYTNVAALVGRSIPEENLDKINTELEKDIMIRAIHDVKGIDMGSYLVRYKAELDFDGRELTRAYLDKQNLNDLLEEIKKIDNIDKLEDFMLVHGENIVDMMGGEIDRIELKLRKKYPEIRHCDLEIL
nr:zinc transporter 9-like isoform X2 [Leptinotarsa decemlineata]